MPPSSTTTLSASTASTTTATTTTTTTSASNSNSCVARTSVVGFTLRYQGAGACNQGEAQRFSNVFDNTATLSTLIIRSAADRELCFSACRSAPMCLGVYEWTNQQQETFCRLLSTLGSAAGTSIESYSYVKVCRGDAFGEGEVGWCEHAGTWFPPLADLTSVVLCALSELSPREVLWRRRSAALERSASCCILKFTSSSLCRVVLNVTYDRRHRQALGLCFSGAGGLF